MVKRIVPIAIILFLSSCALDIFGFLATSADVDTRFSESGELAAIPDLTIATNDYTFIVISDLHVYSWDNGNFDRLKARLTADDQFVLACGDLTQQGELQYMENYRDLMNGLGLPFYSTPGNHDLYFGGWTNFRDILGPGAYTLKAGNIRLISFDSASGTLGADQRAWLENILRTYTESVCAVFTHFEFFSPSIFETQQYTDIEEVYYLMDLFSRYGVDYVFMGHSHKYDDRTVNGVRYVVCEDFKENGGNSMVIRVHVNGGSITHTTFMLNN
jgi:3',5'-cyclic AMP phosphodiesterase CpdA